MFFNTKTNRAISLIFSILIGSPLSIHAKNITPISFQKALGIALNNNPSIKMSRTEMIKANGSIQLSNSLIWPKLNFELHGSSSNDALNVLGYKLSQRNTHFSDFGAEQYTGSSSVSIKPYNLNHPGFYHNLNAGLNLTMPIYTGGKIISQQKSARAYLRASTYGVMEASNQLALMLYKTYEGFLVAKDLIALANTNVRAAREYVDLTQRLSQQSITLNADVIAAKNYLLASKNSVDDAKMQANNMLDDFNVILGGSKEIYSPKSSLSLNTKKKHLNQIISVALNTNSKIKALEEKITLKNAQVSAVASDYKPQLNIQAQQAWNGRNFNSGATASTVSLNLGLKLFTAGEKTGAIGQASADLTKAKFALNDEKNKLELELRKTWRQKNQAEQNYRTFSKLTKQTKILVDTLKERYGRGLVPLSALLDSQMRLIDVSSKKIQARYQVSILNASLLARMSQLVPTKFNISI